jgi:crossover junction endonuclease MUS81
MILIKVDFREKDLIALLQLKMMNDNDNDNNNHNNHIKLKVDNLKIGDVAFIEIDKNENEIGNELLLFERKSLNDLASSIKDGRYAEQSYRLDGYQCVPNHNIVYLIEGDISRYRESQYHNINKKTLLSSMFSILYYKGFSVVRTMNVLETCELISTWADKLERESNDRKKSKSGDIKKMAYYKSNVISVENDSNISNIRENKENMQFYIELNDLHRECEENEANDKNAVVQSYDYCSILKVKKEKNANITPENIGVIMLSTIPGISSKTAIVIMNEFKTIAQLIKSFELNPHCLNHICIETNSGKTRKIASTCIENIGKYLMTTHTH